MKVSTGTLEKVFLPLLGGVIISGVTAVINIYTKLEVVETKVVMNNARIIRIFDSLEKLREGQKDILKTLLEESRGYKKNH